MSRLLCERPVQDDLLARQVLQCAQGALQKWPEAFAGFSARIRCREADREVVGEVRVYPRGRADVDLTDPERRAWAAATLRAIADARTPCFFKDGDGRFPISFEPDDGHPLGRRVRVELPHDGWRAYRIDGKSRIRELERREGTRRTVVAYDGFVRTSPGRVLPTRTYMIVGDVAADALAQTIEVEDAHLCLEHVWLPASRRTTLVEGPARRTLVLELDRHGLL